MASKKTSDERIEQHVSELRKHPAYDPRREHELDELYRQYIPPHSLEETSHLLDVAERDAYIDPFPPIGSQKLAGAAIKKGVRVAIGWYIQYIAQQISTFGSGVAQALRSLSRDVDEIKTHISLANTDDYLHSLHLESLEESHWKIINDYIGKPLETVVISQGVRTGLSHLSYIKNPVIIDPRIDFCSELDASLDTRIDDFVSHTKGYEDNSVDGVILHGLTLLSSSPTRISALRQAARITKSQGPIIIIFPNTSSRDITIATELSSTPVWSRATWEHIAAETFDNVDIHDIDNIAGVIVASHGRSLG